LNEKLKEKKLIQKTKIKWPTEYEGKQGKMLRRSWRRRGTRKRMTQNNLHYALPNKFPYINVYKI
jgi:hypothetical protein